MTVVAGIDVGNATTEVVLLSPGASGRPQVIAAGRAPTRGRKGSPESLHGAVALMRRLERQAGVSVTEARIAPLRPVDTSVQVVADVPPATGRLRILAAGVVTPGGEGACAGPPLLLSRVRPPDDVVRPAPPGRAARGNARPGVTAGRPAVVLVPAELGYAEAAGRISDLVMSGTQVGAVLVAGDEGVLIANRLPDRARGIPVIDQADVPAAASCSLLAVEVRPPGHPLTMLADPVALGAALGLQASDGADLSRLSRSLLDHSNAVVGLAAGTAAGTGADNGADNGAGHGGSGAEVPGAAPGAANGPGEPLVVLADGQAVTLRMAARQAAGWAPGAVRGLSSAGGLAELDDLFAVDLAMVAESAMARRGSTGRSVLVAALNAQPVTGRSAEGLLSSLLRVQVSSPVTEAAAARLGAATTPGMAAGALVADIGSGTIDVIAPQAESVVAGAGDLLTAAVAQLLGVPRAAADWIKRGPCVRVDGTARYEAEDGTRGFLPGPAPASAAGMLAVPGPGGLLPFGGRGTASGAPLGPAEWRAIRLRLKQAVLAASLRRALDAVTRTEYAGYRAHSAYSAGMPAQLVLVGGPAGDDELVGVLARSLPEEIAIGRGNVGATLGGDPLGHRYAVALGLALAPAT